MGRPREASLLSGVRFLRRFVFRRSGDSGFCSVGLCSVGLSQNIVSSTTVFHFSATVFSATALVGRRRGSQVSGNCLPALAVGAVTAFALALVLFFAEPVTQRFRYLA